MHLILVLRLDPCGVPEEFYIDASCVTDRQFQWLKTMDQSGIVDREASDFLGSSAWFTSHGIPDGCLVEYVCMDYRSLPIHK